MVLRPRRRRQPRAHRRGGTCLADFDVLCLQEIAVNYPGLQGNAGHDQPALLRELLPGFQVLFGAAVDEWTPMASAAGSATWLQRRLPVAQVQHHALPYPGRRGGQQHSAHVHRAHSARPRSRSGARHDNPSGVLFQAATHGTGARLRELHMQACAHAAAPPEPIDDGSPFQTKVHTANAILCGDFNLEAQDPEYALIQQPFGQGRFWDSWRVLHGKAPIHRPSASRPSVWARPNRLRLHLRQ